MPENNTQLVNESSAEFRDMDTFRNRYEVVFENERDYAEKCGIEWKIGC